MIKFVFLEELPFRGPQKGQWKNLVATKNDFLRFRSCCWPTQRWKAVCSSARTKAPRIKNTASTSTSWACCFIPSRRTGSLPTATTRRWGMFYSQSWNPERMENGISLCDRRVSAPPIITLLYCQNRASAESQRKITLFVFAPTMMMNVLEANGKERHYDQEKCARKCLLICVWPWNIARKGYYQCERKYVLKRQFQRA